MVARRTLDRIPAALTGFKFELRLISPLGGPERKLAEGELRTYFPGGPGLGHTLRPAWSPDSRFLVITDHAGEKTRMPYSQFPSKPERNGN